MIVCKRIVAILALVSIARARFILIKLDDLKKVNGSHVQSSLEEDDSSPSSSSSSSSESKEGKEFTLHHKITLDLSLLNHGQNNLEHQEKPTIDGVPIPDWPDSNDQLENELEEGSDNHLQVTDAPDLSTDTGEDEILDEELGAHGEELEVATDKGFVDENGFEKSVDRIEEHGQTQKEEASEYEETIHEEKTHEESKDVTHTNEPSNKFLEDGDMIEETAEDDTDNEEEEFYSEVPIGEDKNDEGDAFDEDDVIFKNRDPEDELTQTDANQQTEDSTTGTEAGFNDVTELSNIESNEPEDDNSVSSTSPNEVTEDSMADQTEKHEADDQHKNEVTEAHDVNEGEVTEHAGDLNEGKATENTGDLHEGEAAENPGDLDEGEAAENPGDLNEGEATENPGDLHEGEAAENPGDLNEGEATENPGDLHEGEAAENPGDLNEGEATEQLDDINESGVTEHSDDLDEIKTEHAEDFHDNEDPDLKDELNENQASDDSPLEKVPEEQDEVVSEKGQVDYHDYPVLDVEEDLNEENEEVPEEKITTEAIKVASESNQDKDIFEQSDDQISGKDNAEGEEELETTDDQIKILQEVEDDTTENNEDPEEDNTSAGALKEIEIETEAPQQPDGSGVFFGGSKPVSAPETSSRNDQGARTGLDDNQSASSQRSGNKDLKEELQNGLDPTDKDIEGHVNEFSHAAFRRGDLLPKEHKMPEKVVSFTGREVDEMTEHEDDYDGYDNYEGESDYYLPQDGIQLESERSTSSADAATKRRKMKEQFKWYNAPEAKNNLVVQG